MNQEDGCLDLVCIGKGCNGWSSCFSRFANGNSLKAELQPVRPTNQKTLWSRRAEGRSTLTARAGRIIEARGTLGLFFRCSESANSWNQVSILGNDFTEAHSRSHALAAPVDAVRNSDSQRSLTVSGSRTICGHGPDLPRFWIIQGCGGKPASISCP